ncbi:MAG: flagellar hook protein FlgE [Sutterellaceae bacterium]|nr:flagellar hook protein FlgE [Burkholderiaceae bacterium]MDW8429975.1 flagellar hook protein FlgE [Sutterellaceae bacterium]
MSFQQGLSGLNVAAKSLDAIGNNIANASTVGYKAARAEFADVFANSLAGGAGLQVGIGAKVAAVRQQFTQGNIATTSNPLDVAINGNGFFRLSTNGAITYTRNGQFSLDRDGYLVTANGARLTGYPADANGQVVASTPVELRLSLANIAPRATAEAWMSLNLDSREAPPTSAFSISNPASYNASTAMTVYDSQGNAHTLTAYFRKTGPNTWDVYAAGDGSLLNGGAPIGTLTFNASGTLAADVTMTVSMPLTNGAVSPLTFPLTFPMHGMTQFGVNFAVSELRQDGFTTGRLAGFAIGEDGVILGRYSNGQSRAMGQIVLANFINAQGLVSLGNNQWAESSDSGQPLVAAPGSGTLGVLQSGALEEANVDLTEELVKMITAQRVYQANAQTIRTQDQIQQTLVNLR